MIEIFTFVKRELTTHTHSSFRLNRVIHVYVNVNVDQLKLLAILYLSKVRVFDQYCTHQPLPYTHQPCAA